MRRPSFPPVARVALLGALLAAAGACWSSVYPVPARRPRTDVRRTATSVGARLWLARPSWLAATAAEAVARETARADGDVDVLLVVQTTASMDVNLPDLPRAAPVFAAALDAGARLAVAAYRGYHDEYFVRLLPFTADAGVLERALGELEAGEGSGEAQPLWAATWRAVRALDWDEASTPVLVLLTVGSPLLDERDAAARTALRAWIAERGAHVHLVYPDVGADEGVPAFDVELDPDADADAGS
jgi:Mg-chelatase subunit ChlD